MPTLAIFDFDGTLIRGDSLWLFITALRGRGRALRALLMAMLTAPASNTFWYDPRTAIKERWLAATLADATAAECAAAAALVRDNIHWLPAQRMALEQHAADGATILIATGALDVYITTLLDGLPITAVLCTPVERDENGTLTGRMGGNAVRAAKAARVAAYIKQHGPFTRIIGYGNLPHDRQMLGLCTEAHFI